MQLQSTNCLNRFKLGFLIQQGFLASTRCIGLTKVLMKTDDGE